VPEKTVAHAPDRCRYELRLDGEVVGVADYRQEDGVRAFTHTETDRGHRGQGLAAELVEFALRETEEAGLGVLPYCWYVRDYIAANPQYLELVSEEGRGRLGLV
jgi:predicted GNAT family acetyltransferase